MLIARSIERIADNAVDIAEQAAFVVTAEHSESPTHRYRDTERPNDTRWCDRHRVGPGICQPAQRPSPLPLMLRRLSRRLCAAADRDGRWVAGGLLGYLVVWWRCPSR